MHLNNAIINISNLRLRTYIGFNQEEKEKKQDVVINIEINYAVTQSVLNDEISDALNYRDISKKVIEHVEQGSFLLLEKLVADVLDICSQHQSVNNARVTVDKPYALRFADSVSITFEYSAEKKSSLRLLGRAS